MKRANEKDFLSAVYTHLPREVIKATVTVNRDSSMWMLNATWYANGRKTGCEVPVAEVFPEWKDLCAKADVFAALVKRFIDRSMKMETV